MRVSGGQGAPAHDEGPGHGEVEESDAADDEEEEVGVQDGHVPDQHVGAHGDQLQEQVALDGDGRAGRLRAWSLSGTGGRSPHHFPQVAQSQDTARAAPPLRGVSRGLAL